MRSAGRKEATPFFRTLCSGRPRIFADCWSSRCRVRSIPALPFSLRIDIIEPLSLNARRRAYGLTSDPAGFILYLLYFAVSVLLTLTLHEIAHGYVAWKCGDPTAKMLGRLSLDPRRHLDPLGTLCLIFLGFGWAKPVPVNPRNFQNYRRDDFLVSIAGITVNLTLFLLSLALAVGFNSLLWKPEVINFYGAKELLSSDGIGYAVLLGGAGADNVDAMRYPWVQYIQRFLLMFSTMNLCVGIFNLLPIPPLDGFHILNDVVLRGRLTLNQNMFQITQVVLIALCLTGALTGILSSVTGAVEDAVLNLMLAIAGRG